MRKYEFRGKHDKHYTACDEWIYGIPYIDKDGDMIITTGYSVGIVYPESVGEYIGRLDKNKKEIYENDIVKGKVYTPCGYRIKKGVVKYIESECAFKMAILLDKDENIWDYKNIPIDVEVLGNTCDNPDIL